jgi:hypothetical protein
MSEIAANREVTRTALEQVCARGDMTLAPSCYAEDFADHVGRLDYHGLDGVRKSTSLYQALLDDLSFEVSTRSPRAIVSPAGSSSPARTAADGSSCGGS